MPRPEKVQAVADIKERISNAQAVFLAEYAGLSVSQQQTLRRELKANGAEFKVVKMTLARLAASELDIDTLDEHLLGPTGLAIADGDAVAAAKVLKDFGKANEVFNVKAGLLGLEYLSPERVSELADIEPREVLLAKLAGLFAAPMGNTAGLLAAVQRDVVGLVQALVGKREDEGEVAPAAAAEEEPAADDAAEEAPAEEASAPSDEGADEAAEPSDEASEEDAAPEASDETPEDDSSDDDTSEEAEPEASAEAASEEDAPAEEGEEGEGDEAASSEDEESPAEADGDEEAEEE